MCNGGTYQCPYRIDAQDINFLHPNIMQYAYTSYSSLNIS